MEYFVATSVRELVVFIASPSDVPDERNLVREVAEALNARVGELFPVRLRPIGWETVQPAVGRPQGLINPMVDSCDVFVGILNQRWGSHTGTHDSGFHEEFERALAKLGELQGKRVGIFFRKMPPEILADPGPKAKLVIDFRRKVIEEHLLLFSEFEDSRDFQVKLERFLLGILLGEIRDDQAALEHLAVAGPEQQVTMSGSESKISSDPSLMQMRSVFKHFSDMLEIETVPHEIDPDRLLLFASSISGDGLPPSVHLVNRIYRRSADLSLMFPEQRLIFRSVLADIGSSVPESPAGRVYPGWRLLVSPGSQRVKLTPENAANDLQDPNKNVVQGYLYLLHRIAMRPPALWPAGDSAASSADAVSGADLEVAGEVTPIQLWQELFNDPVLLNSLMRYIAAVVKSDDVPFFRDLVASLDNDRAGRGLSAVCDAVLGDYDALARFAGDSFFTIPAWIQTTLEEKLDSIGSEALAFLVSGRHDSNELRIAALKSCVERDCLEEISLNVSSSDDRQEFRKWIAKRLLDEDIEQSSKDGLLEKLRGTEDKTGELRSVILAATLTEGELRDAMLAGLGAVDAWVALCLKVPSGMLESARDVMRTDAEFVVSAAAGLLNEEQQEKIIPFLKSRAKVSALEVIGAVSRDEVSSEDLEWIRKEAVGSDLSVDLAAIDALCSLGEPDDAEILIASLRRVSPGGGRIRLVHAALELAGESAFELVLASRYALDDEISFCFEWIAAKGPLSDELIKKGLRHEKDKVRAAVARLLYKSLPRERTEKLLYEYGSSGGQYYYNVVAVLDDLIYGPEIAEGT